MMELGLCGGQICRWRPCRTELAVALDRPEWRARRVGVVPRLKNISLLLLELYLRADEGLGPRVPQC